MSTHRCLCWAVFLLATITPCSASGEAEPLEVNLHGNLAIIDPVLVRELALPELGPATYELAHQAQTRLEAFYAQTGYTLAHIHAIERDGALELSGLTAFSFRKVY